MNTSPNNEQWKISNKQRQSVSPLPNIIQRSQSPFTKPERYKPKSPIIKRDNTTRLSPLQSSDDERFFTPIEESIIPDVNETNNATKEHNAIGSSNEKSMTTPKPQYENSEYVPWTWWSGYAFFLTCCIPSCILSAVGGKRTKLVQQAWREKIALCSIIILLCACLGFLTFGMRFALCPHELETNTYSYINQTSGKPALTWRSDIVVYGKIYPFNAMSDFLQRYNISLSRDFEGANLSPLFDADPDKICAAYTVPKDSCYVANQYTSEPTASLNHTCIPIHELTSFYSEDNRLEFSWNDLQLNLQKETNSNATQPTLALDQKHLMLLSDTVIDIQPYLTANESIFGDTVDRLLRQTAGQDATYIFSAYEDAKTVWPCITKIYAAGVVSSDTMGCIAYDIVTDFFLAVVAMLMVIRYSMALVFHWWVSRRLTMPGGRSRGIFAWRSIAGGNQFPKKHRPSNSSSSDTLVETSPPAHPGAKPAVPDVFEFEPRHTILFVTCYSEGRDSIQSTLDSLAETTYSNKHKLLFIVADGIITGSGNSQPTSEICRDLLDLVECEKDEEEPAFEYEAIADGPKRVNRARIYRGYYRSVPAILVVKCGTEAEAVAGNNKPGNRGKRDSQMILMTFFQRIIFYDTFTPLDYEIFWKMKQLMGTSATLSPDKFELVLMVDADTRVAPDSITHMVAAMNNDITLMGLCGETKVANKSESWVTAIQVFEYFISHHYAKAFESIFGGVTCLPGCFSMYRIKAPKHGGWVPILANPDIIHEFNVTTVNTLHAKNLLLLGEDRFLSTLMLRVFPRRQMIFVPQAKCRTVVPNSFAVLLSQRRRWINSTVHNLMELALVSDLCGIACLSMQFVVVIDLISSIVLPAAVLLLLAYFVNLGFTDSPQYQQLFILLATLGLPALLILFTAKKLSYIGWMLIYIMALPIWNFILPIYSFWHFDDFSWGETRKVDDSKELPEHIKEDGPASLPIVVPKVEKKLWHVWEYERLKSPTSRPQKTKRAIPATLTAVPPASTEQRNSISNSTAYPIYPKPPQHPMYFYPNNASQMQNHLFYGMQPQQQQPSPLPIAPQRYSVPIHNGVPLFPSPLEQQHQNALMQNYQQMNRMYRNNQYSNSNMF